MYLNSYKNEFYQILSELYERNNPKSIRFWLLETSKQLPCVTLGILKAYCKFFLLILLT